MNVGPSEVRFSRWGNANAERFEQRRRSQEELEAEIRRDRRFDGATKIVHTHDSVAAASEPKTSPFRSRGTPSLPSARSIPGRRSKYSKPDSGPSKPKNKPKVPDSPPQLDAKAEVKLSEDGLSYVIDGAPFEFKYSYTETPKVKPLKLREPAYAPFGPTTMGRPWTGRAPLPQSQKAPREFDSFRLPPAGKKGVKPIQKPGPFRPGVGPRGAIDEGRDQRAGYFLLKDNKAIEYGMRVEEDVIKSRDGLTHNMLNNIHDLWKRRRVCKIKCKGVCTVDMDNVCEQLEEKIGGKVIYRRGGVIFLFRGRNYNHRTRPRFPLMLWKPVAPVYPRLIQHVPEGLTHQEATEMRRKGRELKPICKLGKNGVYCDLVKNVKEAFEVCELVRIDCQGMKGSDFRKIGAKLKDLVPCVLISFENEQILMWRGREWKSFLTTPDKKDDILGDIDVDTASPEDDDETSMSPDQTQIAATQNSLPGSMEMQEGPDGDDLIPSAVDILAMEGRNNNSLQSSSKEDATADNYSLGDHQEPEQDPETSEEINKQSIERVLNLMKQAVESGTALVLEEATDLDADAVFAKSVAFSNVATPGPVFQHGLRKEPVVKKQENRVFGYQNLEAKTSDVVVVSGKKEVAVRVERDEKKEKEGLKKKLDRFDEEDYREVIPQGTLKCNETKRIVYDYVSAQSTPLYTTNDLFKPSLAIITGVFSIVFTLTFVLLVYAKCFHNDLRSESDGEGDGGRQDRLWQGLFNRSSRLSGLNKTEIESLPFFRFSALKGSKQGLECSVCLSKFEDVEILRLLPRCKHAFHIGCIDQWLEQHATCPLCRNRVSIEDELSALGCRSSNSLRLMDESQAREEDSSLEIYIEREEGISDGSSRFSSFRKILKIGKKEKSLSLDEQGNEKHMHKFNHRIVVSDAVFKNRWSNVTSSDLTFLTSEMLNSKSSDRFSSMERVYRENGGNLREKEDMEMKRMFKNKDSTRRAVSEITAVPRLSVLQVTIAARENAVGGSDSVLAASTSQSDSIAATEERRRRLWLPIARKTAQWFVNREKRNELNTSRRNLNRTP
ncbi:unnamed protein product [Thlaspi arvense]|uniref:RING-type E3 ubiquitin transferase n=1 Tax=Thlaspi arvense TaxID=13288 RepID=A0AAU9RXC9_THLAR|nr:unnamed protein product [Thlaspi arvense]